MGPGDSSVLVSLNREGTFALAHVTLPSGQKLWLSARHFLRGHDSCITYAARIATLDPHPGIIRSLFGMCWIYSPR